MPQPSDREPAVGPHDADVPEVRARRDDELAAEGWTRRFTGSPPRLSELTALYEELGYEVLLDPILPGELGGACVDCTLALTLFKVIYTRSEAP